MPRHARSATVFPVAPIRELEVLRITDVTPGMRRVTLDGKMNFPAGSRFAGLPAVENGIEYVLGAIMLQLEGSALNKGTAP